MASVWSAISSALAKQSDRPPITYVEGVGNEVLIGLGAALAIFTPIIISVLVKRSSGVHIHPAEAENVQATRETLGVGAGNTENETTPPPRNMNDGEPCPICLMPPRYLVVTNCGHGFCGQCLTTYWRTSFPYGAMTCPVCRQQITMLFNCFNEAEITEQHTNIQNSIHQYNRRFSSQPRTIMEYTWDLPTLLQQLFREFFSGSGLVLRFRIILCFVAALLYVLSPIDILSEAVFGLLGFLDDIVIALFVLFYVSEVYRNVVADRAATALDE